MALECGVGRHRSPAGCGESMYAILRSSSVPDRSIGRPASCLKGVARDQKPGGGYSPTGAWAVRGRRIEQPSSFFVYRCTAAGVPRARALCVKRVQRGSTPRGRHAGRAVSTWKPLRCLSARPGISAEAGPCGFDSRQLTPAARTVIQPSMRCYRLPRWNSAAPGHSPSRPMTFLIYLACSILWGALTSAVLIGTVLAWRRWR